MQAISNSSRLIRDVMQEKMKKPMKKTIVIGIVTAALLAAVLGLPLVIGVWTPDVIFAHRHTIAQAEAASGNTFKVVQYWNRFDFYNTELIHTDPTGISKTYVLDGDDAKSWSVPISIDEQKSKVTIVLGGNRPRTMSALKTVLEQGAMSLEGVGRGKLRSATDRGVEVDHVADGGEAGAVAGDGPHRVDDELAEANRRSQTKDFLPDMDSSESPILALLGGRLPSTSANPSRQPWKAYTLELNPGHILENVYR